MYYLKQKFAIFAVAGIICGVYGHKANNSPGTEMVSKTATVTHKMIVPQGESRADLVLVYQMDHDGSRGSMNVDNVSYAVRTVGDKIVVNRTQMEWSHNDDQQSHQGNMVAIAMVSGMISFLSLCSMVII